MFRNMLPMTVKCNHGGNYLYIGTKIQYEKRESVRVWTENYLDQIHELILIYLLVIVIVKLLLTQILGKMEPKNYDLYRDAKAAEEILKQMRANEEQGDSQIIRLMIYENIWTFKRQRSQKQFNCQVENSKPEFVFQWIIIIKIDCQFNFIMLLNCLIFQVFSINWMVIITII